MAEITDKEKELLKLLVKKEISDIEKEEKTIAQQDFIGFLSAEEKYDKFLKNLLRKLE